MLLADFEKKNNLTALPTADEQHSNTVPSVYSGVAPKGDNIFTSALKSVGGLGKEVAAGIIKPVARMGTNLINAGQIVTGQPQTQPFSGGFLGDVQAVGDGGDLSVKNLKDSAGVGAELASNFAIPSMGAGKTVLGAIGKGMVTGGVGGTLYGAGDALTQNKDLGGVLNEALAVGIPSAITAGIFSGLLKTGKNLYTNRLENQANLKLINTKSLLQKESDAVTSHVDEMLSPDAVNNYAKENFNFETPEFLRDKKGNLDSAVFTELKDKVAQQVNQDIPFSGSQDTFNGFMKGKPMTEDAMKSAYLDTVNKYRVLDPKTALYTVENGKTVSDKVAKELIANKVPVSDIQVIKSMNDSEKTIAKKMLNLADENINNPLSADRITKPIGQELVNTYDNYVVKNGNKIGKELGAMRDSMTGVKIETAPINISYKEMLDGLGVSKNPKTGELWFGNSRVRSSPKIMDAILKVDNEISTLGADKTAKNADVIAENLRQIVQDEPSVQGTYAQKLIGNIKTKIDDSIDGSISGYKQAKTAFAQNKTIQNEMESIFGNNFDVNDPNRGAELVRRLAGNASTRLQNLVDSIQAEAEKSGYKGANLKGLTRVASTLERVLDLVPTNSLEGSMNNAISAGGVLVKAVKGNLVGAGADALSLAKGSKAGIQPQDYVRLFRELIK